MDVNQRKPQQSGTFVVGHQRNDKSAKIVVSYEKRDRIATQWKKNNSWLPKATDILQKERSIYPQFSATRSECYEAYSTTSRSEIQFDQLNKIVKGLIQTDIHFQVAANEGMQETCDPQSQVSRPHRARSALPRCQSHINCSRSMTCRFITGQTTRSKRCILCN